MNSNSKYYKNFSIAVDDRSGSMTEEQIEKCFQELKDIPAIPEILIESENWYKVKIPE